MRGVSASLVIMWSRGRGVGTVSLLCRLSSVAQTPTSGGFRTREVGREQMLSQNESNRINVAEIVRQFQHKDGDTGSTPVQVAVLTHRISHLTEHVKRNRKDFSCQRALVKMVHQRRRLLQYLERSDHKAYHMLLSQLQLRTPRPLSYSRPKS
ncbi:30S ribosomal protein S15 [Geodia barretti]|uniref:30S ribosomal protein S15 n=1 Tax=Geodia barretti TaxID=519541 RepID=A0AA35QXJ1_GEOBA|nr:30S ribosomal protein S15 [Geodia barretti]